jgi:hypothetical protein
MRVDLLPPDLAPAYDEFLMRQAGSLLYYSFKYRGFLLDLLGCEEHYLLATDATGIRGVLPLMARRAGNACVFNSLPYFGSNGGIIADHPVAHAELAKAYHAIACSAATLSSTIITNPFAQQERSRIPHTHLDTRIGQFTPLGPADHPWDALMARIDSSAARNVRKALSQGISVEMDPAHLDRLRRLHQQHMRTIGGTAKGDAFFALLTRHFKPGEDFAVYAARKDGVVIAALLVFYFHRTVEYYMPAVDGPYRALQPLPLLILTAMADASRRAFAWWNWGGTWTSQLGVYRFKKKWGALEQTYYYHTQVNDPALLDCTSHEVLARFPHFFVVPFATLKG